MSLFGSTIDQLVPSQRHSYTAFVQLCRDGCENCQHLRMQYIDIRSWCNLNSLQCLDATRDSRIYSPPIVFCEIQQAVWRDLKNYYKKYCRKLNWGTHKYFPSVCFAHLRKTICWADFMLRQHESRAFLGKYLNDLRVPWRHKRREMMAIVGIILASKWLAKIKQRSDVSCRLCKRAREQRGASTENLPEETYGHINSANGDNRHGCPTLALETSVCQHASCTNTNE